MFHLTCSHAASAYSLNNHPRNLVLVNQRQSKASNSKEQAGFAALRLYVVIRIRIRSFVRSVSVSCIQCFVSHGRAPPDVRLLNDRSNRSIIVIITHTRVFSDTVVFWWEFAAVFDQCAVLF